MKYVLLFSLFSFSINVFAIPKLSQNLMVTGPSELALKSAIRVAREGGNPVDIAVAYGLTLSVTHPYFGSLGGGGFALINMDGKPQALDFRESAPKATTPEYYTKKRTQKGASITGGAAVGVPGAVMGFWEMHQKYGKLKWSRLFNESLYYSKKGFPVSSEWYSVTKKEHIRFWDKGAHHLMIKKKVPLPGDTLKQPGLYKALKLIRNKGPKGFYQGPVAQDLVESVTAAGGDMALEDLKNYQTYWRKPLVTDFKENKIYLMPPPSSGGVIIKTALELVEKLRPEQYGLLSVNELHVLGEIMSLSFKGRALLGDPEQNKNPIQQLTNDKYITALAKKIKLGRVVKDKPFSNKAFSESGNTTHFVVMNKKGQAVSLTITLNGNYGSGVITKKYGIALNNEMDDFATLPGQPNMYGLIQGKANEVNAGKRPLSSMSPTLVLNKNNKTILAVGAPGGPRIINGVFQTLYRSLVSKLNMEQAIYTPRLHHQFLPRTLFYEENKFSPLVLNALKKQGHKLKPIHGVGIAYGIKINEQGLLEGAADYRGEGSTDGI